MSSEATHSRPAAKLLLIILAAVLLPLTVVFILHSNRLNREARILMERGWRYAAADGDYSLSYLASGNDAGAHRIIALADLGVNDYSIQLRNFCSALGDSNLIVCIDRAGCGMSIDTQTPQTVEQIVSDYRTALKNANIEPPYVLLPHAFGGIYAAYWESMYPDEIEGVFFLDGTVPDAEDAAPQPEKAAKCKQILAHFGVQRLKKYPLPVGFSGAETQSARFLNIRGAKTAAQISERQLAEENCRKVSQSIVTNDIPKAYINAASYKSPEDWLAADDWARTFRRLPDLTDDARRQLAEEQVSRAAAYETDVLQPYLERLGNCRYYALSGDTCIYMQKPMQCAVLLSQFFTEIEGQSKPVNHE